MRIIFIRHGERSGRGNRCGAFVLDRTAAGGWACSDCYPGSPATA